mmetsp:Transcript_7614/g.14163  ORF Transcript_7614/g.14163 Transcript_7614/m.14163 type:complete len:302 (-) Transcript_7614:215-1120(-)
MTHVQCLRPAVPDTSELEPWWVRLLPPADINLLKVKTHWWRLVWCHERCHKGSDNRMRCHSIRNAIAERGGKLVALRKAARFLNWVEGHQVLPYAVVTDWREAQPIIQSLMVAPPQIVRPSLFVILCESQRQHRRASAWSKTLPSNVGNVIACRPPFVPNELLDGVLAKHFAVGYDVTDNDVDGEKGTHQSNGVRVMEVSSGQSEAPTREPSDAENDHKEQLIQPRTLELAHFVGHFQERLPPVIPTPMQWHPRQEEVIFTKIPEPIHLHRGQDGRLVTRTCHGNSPWFAPGSWTNTPLYR